MRFIPRVTDSGALRVTVEGIDVARFRKSTTWKLRMPAVKVRATGFEGQDIVFPEEMPARDVEAVMSSLSACSEWGYETVPDESFSGAAAISQALLDKAAGVGLAIKRRDASVLSEYAAFSETVNREMSRPLREKQMWDAFFMCSMRKSANFSVPGSGKTASTLGVFAYLQSRGLVDRVIVISPKNAFGSWRDEWASCFGALIPCKSLCFHDVEWASKTSASKCKELRFSSARYNLILLNYEATGNYDEVLREIVADRSLLVFDEVHKVKAIGGVRAASALEASRDAKYVVALTGTPIPNSYSDIYNLLHILYPNDYDSFFGFTPGLLAKPTSSEVKEINSSLQPFFCRTNKQELGVPEASPDLVYPLKASLEENNLLREVREAYRKDPLALIIRCLQMESDPSMLQDVLDRSEFEYVVDGDGGLDGPKEEPLSQDLIHRACTMPQTTKTRECIQLADDLAREGKSVIVWCFFTRSMDNISSALARMGHRTAEICGATPQDKRLSILDDFKAGTINVLVTNPHTLAESVSLHSICHDAIYFEYSYNLVHMLQSKDRIHRLGLPDGQYTQYHFLQTQFQVELGEWSLDGKIYERLKEKERVMLEAIDRGVLEPGSTDKDDLRAVFDGLFDPPLEELQG